MALLSTRLHLLFLFLLLAATGLAQTVTCSSDDGGRHYCPLDARGSNVTIANQRSGSACIQGSTWGYENGNVWVDKGCRADFTAVNNNNSYNNQSNAGVPINCSSENGKRHHCKIDTRGGVRLAKQRSGSPCVQGLSWGFDRKSVWVDKGCRADFIVGGGYDTNSNANNAYNNNGYANQNGVVTCASDNGERHLCPANVRGARVNLQRQLSDAACRYGESWGQEPDGIWVDHGCRAEFTIGAGNNGYNPDSNNANGYNGTGQVITCSSDNGDRVSCAANMGAGRGAVLLRQLSGSPCTQGVTWGYDQNGVWVDKGCRAEFQIR